MRALLLDRWCIPILAVTLLVGWASVVPATGQSDPGEQEEIVEKKAKRIRIGAGQVVIDDDIVVDIDSKAIQMSIEEALREAEEALEGIENDLTYRKVHRSNKVHVGDNVYVDIDEMVNGDVVAVGGNVTIEGKVAGDVVAVFGNVFLENTAVVNGQAVAVFGRIVEEPGARVRGETVSVGPGMLFGNIFGEACCPASFNWRWVPLASLVGMGLLLIVVLLVALVFREGTERVTAAIRRDLLKSWLYGLLAEIILMVVTIVLCITIIGIPVVILLWLAAGLACLWAFAGVAVRAGEAISGIPGSAASRAGTLLIGALAILGVSIIARILSLVGGFFWGPALGIRILGSAITWFALTTGLGAVCMTRFGTRAANGRAAAAAPVPPAVPPAPRAPEVQGTGS
ncbi:MAG: polymer-forming cytoskeletal protein [Candidatus Eisenbacteria sp.]|nr:polymer-forming cytoskeletal protein [Candidatus Eisenbacteria bacterium]